MDGPLLCRWCRTALLCGTILTLSGCAMLGKYSLLRPLEGRIVFQPAAYPAGDWLPNTIEPEDVKFESADGTKLHGWHVPHSAPRAVVLFCHGNAGNVSMWAETLRALNEGQRVSVFSFDYRGYGKSAGKPTEEGILQDARAARTWLARREGIDERDIVLMGQSLGGAVAVDLAANDGARGLVLLSTFTALPDVAKAHMRWFPAWSMMTMRLHSLEKIKNYHGELLICHGDEDEVVPYQQGQRLFAAASEPKQFVTIPGGKHNDPQPELVHVALDRFLNRLLSTGELSAR